MPVAEAFGQSAPLATVLRHLENGVEHLQVGDADVAPLHREVGGDALVLFLSDFHSTVAYIINP